MADDNAGKDLPFRAEYAKSGRASCKGCKSPISQDTLRLAVMMQSPHFDGKVPNWYHNACFWKKARVKTVDDIHGFYQLRNDDQEKVRKAVEGGGAGGDASAGGKKKGKGASAEAEDPATRDYRVEYAKSGGSKCRICEDKIPKGDARLGKMDYESQQAKMYGPGTHWHHVQCFVDKRLELEFTPDLSPETIPGFKLLEKEDQQKIVTLLGRGDARPKSVTNKDEKKSSKKRKAKDDESSEAGGENVSEKSADSSSKKAKKEEKTDDNAELLKKQNSEIWKIRDKLQAEPNLTSRDMKELLELNEQNVPEAGRLIERLADCLLFGALELCPECKHGQLVHSDSANAYRCTGQMTEWAKCAYSTKTPKRRAFEIPDEMREEVELFKKYKYKLRERIFPPDRIQPAEKVVKKEEPGSSSMQTDSAKPLTMLKFALAGRMSKPIAELRQILTNLGANIVPEVDGTVVALVASAAEVKKGSEKSKSLQAAETADVTVVGEDFIQAVTEAAASQKLQVILSDPSQPAVVPDGVINLADLILKHQVVKNCGDNVHSRIRLNLAKSCGLVGKSAGAKSAKSVGGSSDYKSGPEKKTYKVKGRSAVDPDSGLEDEAHVLEEGSCIWNCVLNLVSVTAGTNSYYRLQVLESDKKASWWVFRAWGRIGTEIGGNKLERYSSKENAKQDFEALFLEKTGNDWNKGKYSKQKNPGKFYPVEVDFGVDPDEQAKNLSLDQAGKGSKLPEPVKDLIKLIFDVKMMKKIMAEMEIDLKKMPLGRLSKAQLQSAYAVLSELQALIESNQSRDLGSSSNRQYKFIDASNRFYSLIPHDFGMNSPPLIQSLEMVKEKTEMLDELAQIELAYNLLSEGGQSAQEDPLDVHYKQLKTEIVPVDRDSDEFKLLERYVKNTHASTHSTYKLIIHEIFRVDREGESKRFEPFHRLDNHKLLWHGSRLTNFVGILSQGLRIAPPEAPSTGYMFGKGVYFADMVSKSANYCFTSASNNTGLVLLSDVALGKTHDILHAKGFTKPPSGFDSVKGVGMTCPDPAGSVKLPVADAGYELEIPCGKPTKAGVNGSSLLYNEYIVYDEAQLRLRYLFRMEFKYNI